MSIQRSSLTVFLSQIGVTITGFLSLIYFARVLGPEVLGIYFVYIAVFNLITIFMDGGLSAGTTKRISEGKDASEYFAASLLLSTAILGISLLVLFILRDWIDGYVGAGVFPFLALSIFFMRYTTLFRSTLIAEKKAGISHIINLIEQIVKVLIQILLITLGYQISGLIGGLCIALFVNLPLGLRFIQARPKRPSFHHIKSLFSFSIYSFGIGLNEYLYQSMDIVVIGLLLPKFYSGVYGVSWSFSTVAVLGTVAISTTLFPYISGWSTNGQIDHIRNAVSEALTYSLMLGIPILAGVLVFSGEILRYAYGEAFSVAWLVLIILTGTRLIETCQMIIMGALGGMNRPDLVLKITLVTIPLNLVGNFLLVYAIGIVGAAIATFLTIAVSLSLGLRYAKGIVPICFPWKDIRDESASAIVMISIILLGLHIAPVHGLVDLAAYSALGAAVYFAALFAINVKIRERLTSSLLGSMKKVL